MGEVIVDPPGDKAAASKADDDTLSLRSSTTPECPSLSSSPPLLHWSIASLEVKVPAHASRGWRAWAAPRTATKTLLKDIKGAASRGHMVAVMGSSGAGKSCLLDCLSLRNRSFAGQVFVKGRPADQTYYSTTAYVHATDLFFATLTVREHLTFHGMVRVPSSVPVEERLQRVESVLNAVDMSRVADSLIGGPNTLIRGISGGERKRLSVATELLSDPDVIFADEPTSGLDSFMALSVTRILRTLADDGKLVIAVVHQPSSEIFELFSHLLLLSKGRLAYYGPRSSCLPFLSSLHHHCPAFYNPADFLIETLSLDSQDAKQQEQAQHRVAHIVQSYASSSIALDYDRALADLSSSDRPLAPQLHRLGLWAKAYPATMATQFSETFKRTIKSYKREPVLTRVRFVQAISLGLLLGFVFFRGSMTKQNSVKNRIGALFLIIMNQTVASNFTVSQTIPRELPVFMREYLTSANRVSTYFLALTLAEVPYQVLFPCIFGTLVYWLMGMAADLLRYLTFLLILVLVANAACSMGYAISTLTGHDSMALALGPVLVMPMCLYVGVLHNPRDIPPYFVPLDAISMIHPAFRAMVANEFESSAYAPVQRRRVYDYLDIDPSNLWRDVGILAALVVGFRVAAYLFLLIRARAALI